MLQSSFNLPGSYESQAAVRRDCERILTEYTDTCGRGYTVEQTQEGAAAVKPLLQGVELITARPDYNAGTWQINIRRTLLGLKESRLIHDAYAQGPPLT